MKEGLCFVALLSLGLTLGCGDDGGGGGGGDGAIETYEVSGTVVDFETGDAISGQATVTTANLEAEVEIVVSGADFTVTGVPPGSVFNLLVGADGYMNTYSAAVSILEQDLNGVEAQAVSTSYLNTVADAVGVTPAATKGVLIARAVSGGSPVAGLALADIYVNDAIPVSGPYVLDADLVADTVATETSSSGYVVVFELDPGQATMSAAPDSDVAVVMPASPIEGASVTIADVDVDLSGKLELPVDVSFSIDIVPLFSMRGCDACHRGGGIGNQIGNLFLDGSAKKSYKEVVEDLSPTYGVPRVDLAVPENSLILTAPGFEPMDDHPNTTFASTSDPDYLKLLVWIQEGALDN